MNTSNDQVAATVQVGVFPVNLAFTPGGAFAYVANTTIPVGAGPFGMAITPF